MRIANELADLRSDLSAEIADARSDGSGEIAELRTNLSTEIAELRERVASVEGKLDLLISGLDIQVKVAAAPAWLSPGPRRSGAP